MRNLFVLLLLSLASIAPASETETEATFVCDSTQDDVSCFSPTRAVVRKTFPFSTFIGSDPRVVAHVKKAGIISYKCFDGIRRKTSNLTTIGLSPIGNSTIQITVDFVDCSEGMFTCSFSSDTYNIGTVEFYCPCAPNQQVGLHNENIKQGVHNSQ